MNGLNVNIGNGRIGSEQKPDSGPATLNIKVAHGLNQHDVAVPSNSTFGNLKSVVQKIGLKPETHKLLFRGKEKEDDEFLQRAGVKDNYKVLLMEDSTWQKGPEEVRETSVISRGGAAVAEVREEVDKLSDQVAALQAVVDSGTKVDNKDIFCLTEMLMRQLLKLDGIEAEGEGKVQRKMEVRRVQSFVETMDILKSRNSNLFSNVNNTVPVTTQWETFETGFGTAPAPAPAPRPCSNPTAPPVPSSIHNPLPMLSSTPIPTLCYLLHLIILPLCHLLHIILPLCHLLPLPRPLWHLLRLPLFRLHLLLLCACPPHLLLRHPCHFLSLSNPVPSSTPSPMPSSTNVTKEWERFDQTIIWTT